MQCFLATAEPYWKSITKKTTRKIPTICQLIKKLLRNSWFKGKVSKAILKLFIIQLKLKHTYQNLWDTIKAVLSGELKMLNAHLKKRNGIKPIV